MRFPGLTHLSVGQLLLTAFWGGLRGVYGFPTLTGRFPWEQIQTRGLTGRFQTPQARRVLTGLLFTMPLLLIFGALVSPTPASVI